jgi:hypothetical protein
MSSKPILTREESLKERALQVLNLRHLVENDIKGSYRRKILERHPDKHPEHKGDLDKREEYENKMKVINQSYELLLDLLHGIKIDRSKFALLENSDMVQLVLPQDVKPVPLGKAEMEIWKERYGNVI